MAQFQFNASSVAPDTGTPDPLPGGWFNFIIKETEIKPTRDGSGAYIAVTLETISGHYTGRKVFHNFNIRNSNPTAQEIAYKQLSALCHAIGLMNMQDTSELHSKPFKAKIAVRASEGYDPQNEVKAWRNINEQVETVETPIALVIPAAKASAKPAGGGFGAPAAAFGAAPAAPAAAFPGFAQPQQPAQGGFPAPAAPAAPALAFAAPAAQQPWQQPAPATAAPAAGPANNPANWQVTGAGVPGAAAPQSMPAQAAPAQQAAPAAPAAAPFNPGVPAWAQAAPQ